MKIMSAINKIIGELEAIIEENKARASVLACCWPTQLLSATSSSSPGDQIVPVTFKITGFEKLLNNRNWSSEPFFTSIFGYRIQLFIGVAGWGECRDMHCSIF